MIFKKKLMLHVIVIVLLSAGFILGTFTSFRGVQIRTSRTPLLASLPIGTLKEIVLQGKNAPLVLRRTEDMKWVVPVESSFLSAEEQKVTRLLNVLDEAMLTKIASAKPDLVKSFDLSDDQTVRLVLRGEEGESELILGKPGPNGSEEYLRIKGGDTIYLLSQGLSFYAEKERAYWLNLRFFPEKLQVKDVVLISLTGNAGIQSYRLIREKGLEGRLMWFLDGDKTRGIDQTKAESLAGFLINAAGSGIVPSSDAQKPLFQKDDLQIGFTTGDGRAFALRLYKDADEHYFARGSIDGQSSEYIYSVARSVYERAARKIDDLLQK